MFILKDFNHVLRKTLFRLSVIKGFLLNNCLKKIVFSHRILCGKIGL